MIGFVRVVGSGGVESKTTRDVLQVEIEDCIDVGVREAPPVRKFRKFILFN
jgi:hypothetical protein